jgi:hypothetical protein
MLDWLLTLLKRVLGTETAGEVNAPPIDPSPGATQGPP